ncbi:concanavalin A-like lectin/glucanase domain-containing protein [Cunninghamella echinulata]|nr:concanavalin A-like lectin/glucanase domain-containing protein [Cunninghamella echinulata]
MKISSLFFISSIFIFNGIEAGIFSHRASSDSSTSNNNNNNNEQNDNKIVIPATQKFDYKLSFKYPYYYNNTVPFWTTGGDIIKATDRLRLASSVPGSKGWIWSDLKNEYDDWMVDLDFRITGNQVNGGRGFAFWLTKDVSTEGPIFGAKDKWEGLSIWFVSSNPKTKDPLIMAFINDGTTAMASGGIDPTAKAIGSCKIDYRNTDQPVKMRLSYKDRTLNLIMDTTSHDINFRPCFHRTDIDIPKGYTFGITAASTNPADDHDIISFETYQLDPPFKPKNNKRPLEDEKTQKGEAFTQLTEEQKKKIEQAEFDIKKLREQSEEEPPVSEISANIGILYDTQRRTLEILEIAQLQLEAIGAPAPEKIITGDYQIKPANNNNNNYQQAKRNDLSLDQLKSEAQNIIQRLEKQSAQYEQSLKNVQDTVARVESLVQGLDKRLVLQSSNLHGKLSEITKGSEEARGTMSTLIRYIFYACGLQASVGLALYIYWKLRVEKNDKKFV